MTLKIGRMVIGAVQTNCYFVYDEEQQGAEKDAIVFDAADQGATIYERLKTKGFRVAGILLTHAHFDHIWGVQELRARSGAKVYAYEGERPLCESADLNVSADVGRACTVKPNQYVKDGEEITIAGMTRLLFLFHFLHDRCAYRFRLQIADKGICLLFLQEAIILVEQR